jgi:hypothetical protein
MAKWFYGSGFAWAENVARFSFSVRTVIAASAIAALPAMTKPGSVSGAVPIAVTSRVWKEGSIIVTASANIAGAKPKRA